MVDVKKDGKTQSAEDVAASVNNYFDDDVNQRIQEMTTKEMESVLRELIDSQQWIALLKYNSMRRPLLDATLRGTDPNQEPGKISWAQGALAGLSDIESYVIELNQPKQSESDNPSGMS